MSDYLESEHKSPLKKKMFRIKFIIMFIGGISRSFLYARMLFFPNTCLYDLKAAPENSVNMFLRYV